MILELLKGYKIKIATAKLQSDGDIKLFAENNFRELIIETGFLITKAYLTECDFEWFLAVHLDIPEELQDEFEYIQIFEIKQDDYRSKASL